MWSPASNVYLRGKGGMGIYFDVGDVGTGVPVVSFATFADAIGLAKPAGFEQARLGDYMLI